MLVATGKYKGHDEEGFLGWVRVVSGGGRASHRNTLFVQYLKMMLYSLWYMFFVNDCNFNGAEFLMFQEDDSKAVRAESDDVQGGCIRGAVRPWAVWTF